jgi:hypothetical protein
MCREAARMEEWRIWIDDGPGEREMTVLKGRSVMGRRRRRAG